MSKNKKLTLSEIKKIDAKSFSGKKDVIIKGYSLTIDEVFRPTKIQELISEFIDKQLYIVENEIQFDQWLEYTLLLMIKHFTSLQIPDSFAEQIATWQLLIDNDLFADIVNNINQEEIKKMFNLIQAATDVPDRLAEEIVAKAVPKVE